MFMIPNNVWNEIKTIIPEKKSKVGRPLSEPKTVISGIFYIIITGAQWHKLPDYYGKPTTVHGRFRAWVKAGIFDQILSKSIDIAVQTLGEPESFISDTSSSKAPFATFGGKNLQIELKMELKKALLLIGTELFYLLWLIRQTSMIQNFLHRT